LGPDSDRGTGASKHGEDHHDKGGLRGAPSHFVGIGTALYDALFNVILDEDIHRLVAGITLPNDASVALHERRGFKKVGVFSANGRKFVQYWDVAWFERSLHVLMAKESSNNRAVFRRRLLVASSQ
jgi:hypothetical protein